MESLLGIARYTFKEHLRDRIFMTVLLFGFILLGGALVISTLAAESRLRMMIDLGLAAVEFLSLIAVVFVTVNLILGEIESRTITLLLSHPVKRWHYVTGRFLGTLVAIGLWMAVMAILHIGILFLYGWHWELFYGTALLCAAAKVMTTGAMALVFSLFSTSAPASMTFTLFAWVMGHFTAEMKFLGEKSAHPLTKALIGIFYYAVPNFSYFNYRDFADAAKVPPPSWFVWLFLYAFGYTAVCMLLSHALFEKREF